MSEDVKISYYRENLPDLISDLKTAVQNNRKVITQAVTGDLSEDKYVNVLKSRRMAAEDTIFFLKEIDKLEDELAGREAAEDVETIKRQHPSKRNAIQQ
jgi:hypothetical protein